MIINVLTIASLSCTLSKYIKYMYIKLRLALEVKQSEVLKEQEELRKAVRKTYLLYVLSVSLTQLFQVRVIDRLKRAGFARRQIG